MANRPHATTEEQTAALGGVRLKPMQRDMFTGELVDKPPKRGNGRHIALKPVGMERPAIPGMASWAGGGPEGKRCKDCAYLGAVTIRRPDNTIERSSAACLKAMQRTGRLPMLRTDIAMAASCDLFGEETGVKAWFINWDGATSRADWVDYRGVGRFHALNEFEDPANPGHWKLERP